MAPLVVSEPAAVSFPALLRARPADRRVLAARAARIAFGAALTAGGLLLAADAALHPFIRALDGRPLATAIVAGAWLCAAAGALLAWGAVHAAVRVRDRGRVDDRWLAASFMWPAVGLSLVLPLSLHLPFCTDDFDEWVRMSCAIVGHAHVALAIMSARRMHRIARGERAMPASAIYGVTIGISMIPGGLLIMIPPLLVAVTGLPLLLLLKVAETWIAYERRVLQVPS